MQPNILDVFASIGILTVAFGMVWLFAYIARGSCRICKFYWGYVLATCAIIWNALRKGWDTGRDYASLQRTYRSDFLASDASRLPDAYKSLGQHALVDPHCWHLIYRQDAVDHVLKVVGTNQSIAQLMTALGASGVEVLYLEEQALPVKTTQPPAPPEPPPTRTIGGLPSFADIMKGKSA